METYAQNLIKASLSFYMISEFNISISSTLNTMCICVYLLLVPALCEFDSNILSGGTKVYGSILLCWDTINNSNQNGDTLYLNELYLDDTLW